MATQQQEKQEKQECDYLIVGAGPQGMAFADVLIEKLPSATFIIVDLRQSPGGYWHDACPFSGLHQPSVYYGCTNACLAPPTKAGDARERWPRASKQELLHYYDTVMKGFLQTKRVKYFPMCKYSKYSKEQSMITHFLNSSKGWPVLVKRKVVDTTHCLRVPGSVALKSAQFDVAGGVNLVPASDLPRVMAEYPKYVVLGSGRTAMDSVIWLLSMGVEADMIQWVVPRDHWCFCREAMTPDRYADTVMSFGALVGKVSTHEAAVLELERQGIFCHIHDDPDAPCKRKGPNKNFIEDTAFHGVQVSKEELDKLRQVNDIIRLGHVRAIRPEEIELDKGTVPQVKHTLYIDCTTARASSDQELVPIFQPKQIILQGIQEIANGVGDFNICFQAATVAMMEALWPVDDAKKNSMATPNKPVDNHVDWLASQAASARTSSKLWAEKRLAAWMVGARPGVFAPIKPHVLRKLTVEPSFLKNVERLLKSVDELRKAHSFMDQNASLVKLAKDEGSFSRQLTSASVDEFSRQVTTASLDEATESDQSSQRSNSHGNLRDLLDITAF